MTQFENNASKLFSERIKTLIEVYKERRGKLSHQMLADRVGVSRATVERWISGSSNPLNNDETMSYICDLFRVPRSFFENDNPENDAMYDESFHNHLNAICADIAKEIGLDPAFISLIKKDQTIVDDVISVSEIFTSFQTLSDEVPEMQDMLFQFVSSGGAKIYPSEDVLLMLRVVQRDLLEYAQYLIEKYIRVFSDYNSAVKKIMEKYPEQDREVALAIHRGTPVQYAVKDRIIFPKRPSSTFQDMLNDRNGLTNEENHLINSYRRLSENGKDEAYLLICHHRQYGIREKKTRDK